MLSTYFTEKLLGLKGVIVKNVKELEKQKEIQTELPRKTHVCPCCGHKTDKIHDYRTQRIKDIPSFGKNTVLIVLLLVLSSLIGLCLLKIVGYQDLFRVATPWFIGLKAFSTRLIVHILMGLLKALTTRLKF